MHTQTVAEKQQGEAGTEVESRERQEEEERHEQMLQLHEWVRLMYCV
jgi:hypothetical protein